MGDTCGQDLRYVGVGPAWCGRPAGHDGICWPVPFESDKSSEETP